MILFGLYVNLSLIDPNRDQRCLLYDLKTYRNDVSNHPIIIDF